MLRQLAPQQQLIDAPSSAPRRLSQRAATSYQVPARQGARAAAADLRCRRPATVSAGGATPARASSCVADARRRRRGARRSAFAEGLGLDPRSSSMLVDGQARFGLPYLRRQGKAMLEQQLRAILPAGAQRQGRKAASRRPAERHRPRPSDPHRNLPRSSSKGSPSTATTTSAPHSWRARRRARLARKLREPPLQEAPLGVRAHRARAPARTPPRASSVRSSRRSSSARVACR